MQSTRGLSENVPGSLPGIDIDPDALPHTFDDYRAFIEESRWSDHLTIAQLGSNDHFRIDLTPALGSGYTEVCRTPDGITIYLSDSSLLAPFRISASLPNMVRVRVASSCESEYGLRDDEIFGLNGASAAVIMEPAGADAITYMSSGHERSVELLFAVDVLRQTCGESGQALPSLVEAFTRGELKQTIAWRMPLNPGLLRCLNEMFICELKGRSRRIFIRSKGLEILSYTLAALDSNGAPASAELSTLAVRCVSKAQALLHENYVTPPILEDLAKQVGMSRSALCDGFRQIVGRTVFDYVTELRMQQALVFLDRHELSITEIAYRVGYNQLSSFSGAVQRRFGMSPSELRRRNTPAGLAAENQG